MKLHELAPNTGARKKPKRVGRGPGSGHGKTSCKGEKGQKARSGYSSRPWFEGGQMPLNRRVPKRGFTNIFKKEYTLINLKDLAQLAAGEPITPEFLRRQGLVKQLKDGVKILGTGELKAPLHIVAHKFSAAALEKIKAAGGRAEVLA
jgi:large subunit ribosomal protein L15